MRYVYGLRNTAFYNLRPEGDEVWYPTRPARDRALAALREHAIAKGLSKSAARAGIVAIRRHVASDTGRAWLDELVENPRRPGVSWAGGAP